jgi:hypothetical protein
MNVKLGTGVILRFAVGLVVLLAGACLSYALTPRLIDDFSGLNDDAWTHGGFIAPANGGPPTFDASSGEYSLGSTGAVTPGSPHYVASWFNESFLNPQQFSSGYLRTKFRIDEEGTVAWVSMRALTESYIFVASSETSSFGIQREGDVLRTIGVPDVPPLVVGEQWYMEAGTVGDLLTLRVWPVTGPEPAGPQLAIRETAYSAGGFGLGANISHLHGGRQIVNATFDDLYFTPIPEPSTPSMGLLALIGLAARRIQRRLS